MCYKEYWILRCRICQNESRYLAHQEKCRKQPGFEMGDCGKIDVESIYKGKGKCEICRHSSSEG